MNDVLSKFLDKDLYDQVKNCSLASFVSNPSKTKTINIFLDKSLNAVNNFYIGN